MGLSNPSTLLFLTDQDYLAILFEQVIFFDIDLFLKLSCQNEEDYLITVISRITYLPGISHAPMSIIVNSISFPYKFSLSCNDSDFVRESTAV